ncbi:AAA family ATPase [Qipengyuania sp. XHP0211]|uniref:AAA family ATPase n=1 Tax=Qipengyuania sp. XHP0211 TaxID=3038079 RepID=UPI00241F994D|nr:AAA family ATPase [Qipengyuania sp. XHP0211]MDG5751783.1 AAA family ATPase [Qipengyuania sp. XHP0211]
MADILITGCSGGGKSTLLDELDRRGYTVVHEPGRRLIGAGITPWGDLRGFLTAAADMARADLGWHEHVARPVFYDRGLIDALAGLERDGGPTVSEALGADRPYACGVFLAPPWPQIYAQDSMRRHDFEAAVVEYEHLALLLPALGYEPVELPLVSVGERADFVLANLPA